MSDKKTNVIAVCINSSHTFSKTKQKEIKLIKMIGVEGDAHAGKYVKHLSRVKRDPKAINLRQVHLIQNELFDELLTEGFIVKPGNLGENITTSGIDLINLPKATILKIGEDVQLEITGLRDPCRQIDDYNNGLLKKMISKDEDGNIIRKTGIMTIVKNGGIVRKGDNIEIIIPKEPHQKLEVV
jgi:MOSC domain-containing protein YiiM